MEKTLSRITVFLAQMVQLPEMWTLAYVDVHILGAWQLPEVVYCSQYIVLYFNSYTFRENFATHLGLGLFLFIVEFF